MKLEETYEKKKPYSGLNFYFFNGIGYKPSLTTKKATNISLIASERLSDIDGKMVEINDVSGKRYTILNFGRRGVRHVLKRCQCFPSFTIKQRRKGSR